MLFAVGEFLVLAVKVLLFFVPDNLLLFYSSCIGCPSDDGSTSRSPVWYIDRCLVGHRRIWLLTWLLNVVVKTFVLPVTGHASYQAPTKLSGAGVFLWLDPVCGTVCPHTYDLRCNSGHSSGQLKTVLFGRQRTRRIVTFLFFVRLINTLTYLLTYLLLIDSWSSIQQMVVDQAIDH